MSNEAVNPLDFASLINEYKSNFPTFQILNAEGEIVNQKAYDELAASDDEQRELMRRMVWSRELNARSTILAKQGWMHFHAPYQGQEASQIGSYSAFNRDDFLLAGYRAFAPIVLHGLPLAHCFHWNNGHVQGNDYTSLNGIPPQVIIGAQIVQGAGVGMGLRLRGSKQVALTYTGDGGTSQGDFYEGLNFAGVYKSQIVYIVENNEYAISTHWTQQTAAQTLAQKAVAAGIPGIQVDGMDALAVLSASRAARQWAADGNGPVLIETLTSRFDPHSLSGDDPSIYRTADTFEYWNERDPLKRMRLHLSKRGLWSEEDEAEAQTQARADVKEAMEQVTATPKQKVSDFLRNMFETPHADLAEQIAIAESKERARAEA